MDAITGLGGFSEPSFLILTSLAGGSKHGYSIMEDVQKFSRKRLGPGTLYGALARLEQRGWIEALPAEDRRRPYRLTESGEAALREHLESLETFSALGLRRLGELPG